MAVQKFANDPEVRAKVARVVKDVAVPRAKQSGAQAKPELENVKEQLKQDWEQANPALVKTKGTARDLTRKLTKP